jgi:phage gp46-like protein
MDNHRGTATGRRLEVGKREEATAEVAENAEEYDD